MESGDIVHRPNLCRMPSFIARAQFRATPMLGREEPGAMAGGIAADAPVV
jgi:hypothetical protein